MNDKTIELIRQMAEKLGTTGEHLWSVLVRQAYISGALGIFWFGFIQTLIWVGFFQARKWATRAKKDKHTEVSLGMWILWAVGAAFLTLVSLVCLNNAIESLANPEFYALKTVLHGVSE